MPERGPSGGRARADEHVVLVRAGRVAPLERRSGPSPCPSSGGRPAPAADSSTPRRRRRRTQPPGRGAPRWSVAGQPVVVPPSTAGLSSRAGSSQWGPPLSASAETEVGESVTAEAKPHVGRREVEAAADRRVAVGRAAMPLAFDSRVLPGSVRRRRRDVAARLRRIRAHRHVLQRRAAALVVDPRRRTKSQHRRCRSRRTSSSRSSSPWPRVPAPPRMKALFWRTARVRRLEGPRRHPAPVVDTLFPEMRPSLKISCVAGLEQDATARAVDRGIAADVDQRHPCRGRS